MSFMVCTYSIYTILVIKPRLCSGNIKQTLKPFILCHVGMYLDFSVPQFTGKLSLVFAL